MKGNLMKGKAPAENFRPQPQESRFLIYVLIRNGIREVQGIVDEEGVWSVRPKKPSAAFPCHQKLSQHSSRNWNGIETRVHTRATKRSAEEDAVHAEDIPLQLEKCTNA
ncbi:hypothetical protein E2320_016565 [Naja naja]|nr:hypothetical protein E2320_016565 [Naja naja]